MRVQFRACIVLCSRYRMLSARDFNFDEDTDKRGGSEKGEADIRYQTVGNLNLADIASTSF